MTTMMQSSQDQRSLRSAHLWHRNDHCEDPFPSELWTPKNLESDHHPMNGNLPRPQHTRFNFPFSQNDLDQNGGMNSSNSLPGTHDQWSPQATDDILQGFRNSMQTGELSKLAANCQISNSNGSGNNNSSNNNNNGANTINGFSGRKKLKRDLSNKTFGSGSVSSDASDLSESPSPASTPVSTWSAVVQKNPRPAKQRREPKMSKVFHVSLNACCMNPRLKVICLCCQEEGMVTAKEEMKPRLIPVSTSQLGFCRFCQTNGDPPEVYQTHSLRSDEGKVTCPVLREYNCPICNNGGGDFAHTIKYCPMARKAKPAH